MYTKCSCQSVSYINLFTIQERLYHPHRKVPTIPLTEDFGYYLTITVLLLLHVSL